MEALYFFKFWRPTTRRDSQLSSGNSDATVNPNPLVETDDEFDEEEDSFFDLEFALPDFDNRENNKNSPEDNIRKDNNSYGSSEESLKNSAKNAGDCELKFSKRTLSLSSNDHFSKRKIIPIEPNSKPQSPIALLKAAPKLRVFMFKKSKSMATEKTKKTEKAEKTELNAVSLETPKQEKKDGKLFTVKFKFEEVPSLSTFTRVNSVNNTRSILQKQSTDDPLSYDSSKRFSKEAIQKYLKLIKPLYVKVSKRNGDKVKFSGELKMASPTSSPAMASVYSPKKDKQGNIPAGIRVVCKHLGKSKSASAATVAASPANRRDDSLLLQHDGIQSAILHCKRSFQSSRDPSLLSQSSGDLSQEQLVYPSSEDFSSLSEKSMDRARKFNDEGNRLSI